jgi:hypothetical protein
MPKELCKEIQTRAKRYVIVTKSLGGEGGAICGNLLRGIMGIEPTSSRKLQLCIEPASIETLYYKGQAPRRAYCHVHSGRLDHLAKVAGASLYR